MTDHSQDSDRPVHPRSLINVDLDIVIILLMCLDSEIYQWQIIFWSKCFDAARPKS